MEILGNIIQELPLEPVIYVGARDRNQDLAQAASQEALRELHGDTVVTLASSNTYSQDTIDMTLSQYLDLLERDAHLSGTAKANETYYLFGNNFSELFKRLEARYVLPPYIHSRTAGATTLGIGGLHSGVAFHFHGPGFAEVISGRKLFFLYPPGNDVNVPVPPNLTMATWVKEIYPSVHRKKLRNPAYEEARVASRADVVDDGTLPPSRDANNEGSGNIYDGFSGKAGNIEKGRLVDEVEHGAERSSSAFSGNIASRVSEKDGSGSTVCSDRTDFHSDTSADVRVPPSETLESFYECVLEPGDMLYFPNSWQHATLNLDQFNVFVSVFLDLQLMR
eukprot:CAMPEP_0114420446 /NCGR_PEP_ID=MMETSP0103-20121206/4562_1 /TAXON_ID=37642 ORGANISM="Paraphysomonas imperforata, Strain PA2" /NCGR_SAMPLE_ID=MMETSP0103 /ASSEMBLY_ACC=CAM_ASM_000201 /LENGTH=335 /DNA_ID=CAMNT_0001588927 /DNA_START=179 /DNA_END=1186 /DNA_ORIENTATION=-